MSKKYKPPEPPKQNPNPPKINPFSINHPFYNFPPTIGEKFIVGDDAIRHTTNQILDHITTEVSETIKNKSREIAENALADSLHYATYQHLSSVMSFMKYIRNNIHDEQERERIIYSIDKMLDDSYWKKFLDAERPNIDD